MPAVSIVVPFYNQAPFLEHTLRSLTAQTEPDLEILVVDDGSTEPPDAIVAAIGDPRLRLIRQPNRGVAHARNRGLAESTGEFVAFVDADDALAPAMIDTLANALRGDAQCGFAYCEIQHVDTAGNPADTYRIANARPTLSGDILQSLLTGGYFPPVAVLIRADALAGTGGFDAPLGGCCDWDLWIRLSIAGWHAAFVPEPLAYYRRHEASMSRDASHMRQTAIDTLTKNMTRHPARMAAAMHGLIETSEAIYAANVELREHLQRHEAQRLTWRADIAAAAQHIRSLEDAMREPADRHPGQQDAAEPSASAGSHR